MSNQQSTGTGTGELNPNPPFVPPTSRSFAPLLQFHQDPLTSKQINPQEHVIAINTPSSTAPNMNPNPKPNSGTSKSTNNTGTGTYNRNRRNPLNSVLWISIEAIMNLTQIIASIIVLSLSKNEKLKTPLFQWVIGYIIGCFATLPHLYWRYIHRNVNNNNNPRINALFDHFKMALDCFFIVWFIMGYVWIFGTHSSSEAPTLYKLCIVVFLSFSCIGYVIGQSRGATSASINALHTYNSKTGKITRARVADHEAGHDGSGAGAGQVAADKEKKILPAEDDVGKMLELLVHASKCGSRKCSYGNCGKLKLLFIHGAKCSMSSDGGCVLCKKMWYLLSLHARACREPHCIIPRCKDLKKSILGGRNNKMEA